MAAILPAYDPDVGGGNAVWGRTNPAADQKIEGLCHGSKE